MNFYESNESIEENNFCQTSIKKSRKQRNFIESCESFDENFASEIETHFSRFESDYVVKDVNKIKKKLI